jgi:ABC-type lipoprotein export system ATPase subunit
MTEPRPVERLAEVRDLGHVYRTGDEIVVALRGVEFDLDAGERMAVLGRSGSGKTTLLRILAALDNPIRGRVAVAGQDLQAMTGHQRDLYRRRTVGFVWQEPELGLLPGLTVLQNVLAPMLGDGGSGRRRLGSALRLLENLRLAGRLHELPSELTPVETERLALAVALANRPRLLLADELTARLEWGAARELLEDLGQLLSRMGTAAVVVTNEARLQAYVDRAIAIRAGSMVPSA